MPVESDHDCEIPTGILGCGYDLCDCSCMTYGMAVLVFPKETFSRTFRHMSERNPAPPIGGPVVIPSSNMKNVKVG